ncbi:hypothetical protein KFE80_06890 [bacterium SCSIO 12696]|nr:hypothetical protein KFE80_06890 [bacterium SCSIO 12696]
MKTILHLFVASALAMPVMAAEQPDEKPKEKQDQQEQTAKKDDDKKEKPVIFKPTEELSEDFSVPFPTDI